MGFVDRLTGKTGAKAAKKAGEIQSQEGIEAAESFNPLLNATTQGVQQAGFLTDPNAQFDFLQNNPLFQQALQNANQQTLGLSAAQGRLSSGDTLQQLAGNTLLTAAPLIQGQKQSIGDMLNFQNALLSNQGNLRTGAAAAQAGGIVGAENIRGQGMNNLLNVGGALLGSNIGQGLIKKIPGFGG